MLKPEKAVSLRAIVVSAVSSPYLPFPLDVDGGAQRRPAAKLIARLALEFIRFTIH